MDINSFLLGFSLFGGTLSLVYNIIRPSGIRNAFKTGDGSNLNATGAKILSQDGISDSFIAGKNTQQNFQHAIIDTNRVSYTSGESSTNPIGTRNAEQNLLRLIRNPFNIWDVIRLWINSRFGFGGGKEKKP